MSAILDNAFFSEQVISVLSTYDSTSITSGALLSQGGLGVKLSAHIGEELYVNSVNVTPSLGDIISERENVISNDVYSPASISEFVFYNDITQTFKAVVSVSVTNLSNSSFNKNAIYTLMGNLKSNTWLLNSSFVGDVTGVRFYINNTNISGRSAAEILYTNNNSAGTTTTIRFKANTLSPTGALNDASPYASLPVTLTSNEVTFTRTNTNDWETSPLSVQTAFDEIAERLKNMGFTNEYHVSQNGNDISGNGSMDSPFLTIQAAINESNNLSINTPVVIYIHPGRYTENITITKPLTTIMGMTNTFSNGCQINGNVTITPSDDSLGVFNNLFSIENLLITGRTGSSSVVTFSGVNTGYLNINNCKIYTSQALQKLLYFTNTNVTAPRLKMFNCNLVGNIGTDSIYEIALGCSNIVTAQNVAFYGNTSTPIVIRGSSSLTFTSCEIQGNSTYLVDIISATLVSFINCTLINSLIDSSGVNLSSTAVATMFGCIMSIPTNKSFPTNLSPPITTTGYAVKGVSGAQFTYGNMVFIPLGLVDSTYYWTTNKISSNITVVSSSTTFVAQ
jgi:hypothetical protein